VAAPLACTVSCRSEEQKQTLFSALTRVPTFRAGVRGDFAPEKTRCAGCFGKLTLRATGM
jgi:hypothetical protein